MNLAQRRWAEVEFYYFSLDIYHINNDMLDVASMIETLALMTKKSKVERLKGLSAKLLTDISSTPTTLELVFLMKDQNYSTKEISKATNKSTKQINRYLTNNEPPIFTPKLKESDDIQIAKFMETVHKIKQAGI